MKKRTEQQKRATRRSVVALSLGFFIMVFWFFLDDTCYISIVTCVHAKDMNSQQFGIQIGSVETESADQSSSQYSISTTLGQSGAREFHTLGYAVQTGFPYIDGNVPFELGLSDTTVNFGALRAETHHTAQTTLAVSFGSAGHFQVTARSDGPLHTLDGKTSIPNIKCNGSSETCSQTRAALWTSGKAYGFGYSMTGNDVPRDFISLTHFRPFPDKTESQPAAVVMRSERIAENRKAVATFKTNVSSRQTTGTYTTVIHFVATPTF